MAILKPHLPDYRIAVVGSGAVGCFYGGRLAQFGREVHFLMRSDYAQVKKHGLRLLSKQGDVHLQGVKCHQDTRDIGPCDVVIIALKTTSNAVLPDLLPPLMHSRTMLLTLQNGLGNEEFLASHFGGEHVLGGLCHVCLNRTGPGVVQHLAQGKIEMGEYSGWPLPRTHELAAEFKRCGIICQVAENLMTARWRKLVWNIPFNGLSIIGDGLTTQDILSSDPLEFLVRALMTEVIAVARFLGHEIPLSLAEEMISSTKKLPAYKTSSLIDFLEGREVEIEAIWGEPYRQAFNAGAPVGRLEMLYHLLKNVTSARPG